MTPKIPYGKQFISEEDEKAVLQALHSDFLTQGPHIAEFEKNFAAYIGCKFAVAVSNGTAALHLPLLAMGLKPGDNVITTPITFSASANAARYCGANVFFADIDPETFVISLDALKKILQQHPVGFFKAVIPVDFAGFAVNLEKLKALADEYGFLILEDACHAPGGYFVDSTGQKQFCGNGQFAEATAFSFHPVKHIACGEGGMITTNNKTLYEAVLKLRTHGITKEQLTYDFPQPELQGAWYYEMQSLGYNYRITDIQAALGNSQLKRADAGIQKRHAIAKKYREAFKGAPIVTQKDDPQVFNAYHLFVIKVQNRKGLYEYLQQNGIFAQIHYVPVHLMPYYRQFGWKPNDFPEAENYYAACISLPMYPTLSDAEQNYVIEKVLNFVNG